MIPVCSYDGSVEMTILQANDDLSSLHTRMLELTSRTTPWHRRNWRAGTLELLEEAINDSTVPGTKGEAAKALKRHAITSVGSDPAVSSQHKKIEEVLNELKPTSGDTSYQGYLATEHSQTMQRTYLLNWASLLRDPESSKALDVEGTAKRLVSHLRYCGLPNSSIYSLIEDYENSPDPVDFSSVLEELDLKTKAAPREFTFAVPIDRAPDFFASTTLPPNWLNPQGMKQWKHKHAQRAEVLRHHGGFLLSVAALDVNAAAAEARRMLSQLAFKFESGSRNGFSIRPIMWSQEAHSAFPTHAENQKVKFHAFERSEMLHDLALSPQVRNILTLVEPLQTNDPHVRLINGWAALESLVTDPNEDDRLAAERTARIVAASYFRSEMIWLAHNCKTSCGESTEATSALNSATNSTELLEQFINMLVANDKMLLKLGPLDILAVQKMQDALANPGKVFKRTVEILNREFDRMYRKRNLIVHAGHTGDRGLEVLADSITPLVVEAIDQLLIARLQFNLDPKQFTSRLECAEYDLNRAKTPSGSIFRLLM